MTKDSCPDEWTFDAMRRHQLDDSARRRFERHLDECADCFGALAILADSSSAAAGRVEGQLQVDTLAQHPPHSVNERQRLLAATVISSVIHGICLAVLWPIVGVGSPAAALLAASRSGVVEATFALACVAGVFGLLALVAGIRGWSLQRKLVRGYAIAMLVTLILVPLAGALLRFAKQWTFHESSRDFEPERRLSQRGFPRRWRS